MVLRDLSPEEATAFVQGVHVYGITINTLQDSDEKHVEALGDLYDPAHKWPMRGDDIDMRLFDRSTMVGFRTGVDLSLIHI